MRNAKQMAEIATAAKVEISQGIIDQIEPQILDAAQKGHNSITISDELGDVAVKMLKDLDYGVEQHEDHGAYGEEMLTTITW